MTYRFDRFEFDPADGRLRSTTGGEPVHLRPKAAELLVALLDRAGEVVDRETLVRAVWGADRVVDFEAGLAALLREIRQAITGLGGDATLIETVPRRGYRLRAEAPEASARTPRRGPARGRTATNVATIVATIVAATVVAVAAITAVIVTGRAPDAPPQAGDARSLALMPLESPGADSPRRGILLADTLLAELWKADLPGLELIGRAGMRPYAARDDVASAVARGLGVDLLLEGSFRTGASGWRVDLRLLAVPPGRIVWSQTLRGPETELPISDVAAEAVARLASDWPGLRGEGGG